MLGAGAATLTAWQQAIVAGVFELCLVGVMVIFELLGHHRRPMVRQAGASVAPAREMEPVSALIAPRKPPRKARKADSAGSVKGFVRDHIFPADDAERVDVKSLIHTYRDWCTEKGLIPVDLNAFLDEIEHLCAKLGIRIEVGDDSRVYCHGVKIEALASVH